MKFKKRSCYDIHYTFQMSEPKSKEGEVYSIPQGNGVERPQSSPVNQGSLLTLQIAMNDFTPSLNILDTYHYENLCLGRVSLITVDVQLSCKN